MQYLVCIHKAFHLYHSEVLLQIICSITYQGCPLGPTNLARMVLPIILQTTKFIVSSTEIVLVSLDPQLAIKEFLYVHGQPQQTQTLFHSTLANIEILLIQDLPMSPQGHCRYLVYAQHSAVADCCAGGSRTANPFKSSWIPVNSEIQ